MRFRKKYLLACILLICIATLANAAIVQYFGQINVTATANQAVLLDGKNIHEMPILESMVVAGGESECRAHWLKSLTKVPIAVELETTFSPSLTAEEIGVTYWMVDKYKVIVKTTTSIPADITVEDLGDSIQWTIDMDEVEGPFNNGHAACGLVIGVGNDIVYQVHSNDGTDANYPWGTWLLSYWGPSGTGWHGWHTSYKNIPITEIDGIDASGDRYLVAGSYDGYMPWGPVYHEGNPELVFTITINKGLLHCGKFKWAAALMGDTSDTYTPATFAWSDEDTTNFHTATIGTQIIAPIIIQPHERLDFVACYKFAKNISPRDYNIFTTLDLAP